MEGKAGTQRSSQTHGSRAADAGCAVTSRRRYTQPGLRASCKGQGDMKCRYARRVIPKVPRTHHKRGRDPAVTPVRDVQGRRQRRAAAASFAISAGECLRLPPARCYLKSITTQRTGVLWHSTCATSAGPPCSPGCLRPLANNLDVYRRLIASLSKRLGPANRPSTALLNRAPRPSRRSGREQLCGCVICT